MRKNKMMRLASALLVAVLLTTSVISGTYAKYVTEGSANDSARVAKWGVTITAEGSEFAEEYATSSNEDDAAVLAVKAEEKVVAPGTSSAEVDGDFTFTISGTPEVATEITISFEEVKDVYLNNGTYKDWTKAPYTETFTVNEQKGAYYPIVWTLTVDDASEDEEYELVSGTLAEIQTFVNTYVSVAKYAPGEELDATFTLTWAWAFGDPNNNKADTMLGNLATGEAEFTNGVDSNAYSTSTSFDFTVTVSQVD